MAASAELVAQWPLLAMWLGYFALHSLLAGSAPKRRSAARWPRLAGRYRLAYNLFALASLAPIAAWLLLRPGAVFWAWHGVAAWVANGLALLAVAGFVHSSRHYDMGAFLGLRATSPLAVGAGGFRLSPWHRYVRHPWYSLGLVLVWSRDMNAAMLVSAICISVYFVVGSRWEEAKLIAEFGDAYRRYRRRVPALLPWPGRRLSEAEARELTAGR